MAILKEAWLISNSPTVGQTPTLAAGPQQPVSNLGNVPIAVGATAPSTSQWVQGPHASKGLALSEASTGSATMRVAFLASTDPIWATNVILKTPATNPSAAATFLDNRTASAAILRVQWSTTGQMLVTDSVSTQRIALAATNFTPSTYYRVEVLCSGMSTTAGQIILTVRTLLGVLVATATTNVANLTTVSPAVYATLGATTVVTSYEVHELQTQAGSNAEIGAYQFGATVANAGADQTDIEPYTTVNLAGTDDGTGAPVRTWTQTGGPAVVLTQTGQAASFVAPGTIAGATLTFQYQADTITDTMTVTVLAVTERYVTGGVEVPMQVVSVTSG